MRNAKGMQKKIFRSLGSFSKLAWEGIQVLSIGGRLFKIGMGRGGMFHGTSLKNK